MEWRNVYIMAISFCISFYSRVAVHVTLPAQKPCRASWDWMKDNIRRLMMKYIAFHRTYTRPIYLKSVPPPLGDNHHHLPGTRLRAFSSPEGRLCDGKNLLPVPRVRVFLPLHRAIPHPEVFGPHAGKASSAM